MKVFLVAASLAFTGIVCVVQIPKMAKSKSYKELVVFCIILCFGTILALLKSMDMDVFNPADFIKAIFSPITKLMKNVLE